MQAQLKSATAEEYKRLLELFSADPSEAEDAFRFRYGKLEFYFESHGLDGGLASAVMEIVARQASVVDVRNVDAYIGGVRQRVLSDALRKVRPTTALVEDVPDPSSMRRAEPVVFERCLEKLPSDDRRLIEDYYRDGRGWDRHWREGVARRCGVSLGALRQRIKKIRDRLAACIENR